MTSWKCDVKSKIRLRQSVRIYLKNNHDKFHPDLIWHDRVLDQVPQREQEQEQQINNKNNEKKMMNRDSGSVLVQKFQNFNF